jgi:hypothetical protein
MSDEEHGITRDPETGRIVGKKLNSEKAAAMGRRSHAKRSSETANRILAEAGFDADNPPPEHLAVLAEYAVFGKSGAVAALRDFRRLVSPEDTRIIGAPLPGESCPTCGLVNLRGLRLDQVAMDALKERINKYREQHGMEPNHEWKFDRGSPVR